MKIPPSIFNNVIGPVMRGPSSSHTAASVRIGRRLLRLLGEEPESVKFYFDPNGSVAATYRGQGSAMGLAGGLLGMEISDPDLVKAEDICRTKGIDISYIVEPYGAIHPNTYRCDVTGISGKNLKVTALSTGGGIVKVLEIDGKSIDDDLDYINELMPVKLKRDVKLPFNDIDELTAILSEKGGKLSDYALEYESALGNISSEEVMSLGISHATIMRNAIENGLSGTVYDDRILHYQSHLISKASEKRKIIPAGIINNIIASVSAIMETKSSMGVIVAAPTAGSCGTVAGVVMPVSDLSGNSEKETARAILAAGLFGLFIAQDAGFAAEEGGCQYECGAASGMAAAALVELSGGDAITAINAGSMALQNMLGLICDPVADRVEIPCLGKNIMASLNALAAANMVMAGYDHVIPAREVIRVMKDVGESMDHRYRCTCKGGLSVTPTAQKIYRRI